MISGGRAYRHTTEQHAFGQVEPQDVHAHHTPLLEDKKLTVACPEQALARTAELARRNTQLIEESEAMLQRLNAQGSSGNSNSSSAEASPAGQRGVKQPKLRKGMFSFRRCALLHCPQ